MKKRLVGAVVLIALAVIFVPMLLPSRSGPETASVKVPPPPSGEMQTRVLQVGPGSASAGSVGAAVIADPDHVATLDLGGANQPAGSTASAGVLHEPAEASATTASAPEAGGPAATPTTGSTHEASKPSTDQSASVASAKPEPLPGGAGAAAGTVYTVNLGIYADHASARKLVADAKQRGFTALATPETFQGKQVLRVRVGPFSSKAAAEAARLKLKDFERVAMTVDAATVDQTGDASASALPATQAGAWAVQLAAFSDQSSANKLRDRLRSQGFDGYVDSVNTSKGKLWRVRAGPFATRDSAESARSRIADRIKIKGNIVTE
ncbi:MAG TPA: SPOR domain-containing protein [Rhodanobacteraceae bacterium]|nr:SPOR domain-containing protein [Rhodanobacteraceae bacterium]